MGMSASQARFLSLTARKNNVEFEGQQINQQRTTLSNESASYYSELCNMKVPTPPSIDDYTKVSYSFNDGAMTNTLISLLPKSGTNNEYVVNYVEEWQDDYAIVPASSSLVEVNDPDNPTEFSIGSTKLRLITPNNTATEDAQKNIFSVDSNGTTLYYQKSFDIQTVSRTEKVYVENVSFDGKGEAVAYIDSEAPIALEEEGEGDTKKYYYTTEVTHKIAPLTEWEILNMAYEEEEEENKVTWQDKLKHDNNNNNIKNFKPTQIDIPINSYTKGIYFIYQSLDSNFEENIPYTNSMSFTSGTPRFYIEIPEGETYYNKLLVDGEGIPKTSESTTIAGATELDESDEYIKSLSAEQRDALLKNEQYLLKMAQEKTGDNGNFYIRYVKNTTTGNYEPYLYAESELTQSQKYNNKNLGSIPCYSLGSTTQTREVLHKEATVEKDSSGRYVAITIKLGEDDAGKSIERTYNLVTTTTTDEEAYNDAMNQYNYAQHEYDHKVQEINSKLEIVQQQDKQLELKLKQLDTEENAISTEMDAVKKVISKNVESSFKTFNA